MPVLIVVLIGALAGVTYWVMLLRVDWRSSAAGKSQVLLASAIVGVMSLAVARFAGVDLPDWVRIVVYLVIDVALIGLVVGVRAAQRQGRRRAHEREDLLNDRA